MLSVKTEKICSHVCTCVYTIFSETAYSQQYSFLFKIKIWVIIPNSFKVLCDIFYLILENYWPLLLQYFFPVLSSSGVLIIYIWHLLKLSQSSWRFFFPPLYFNLGNFPYPSSEFTDHFLSCVQSTDEPKTLKIFVCCCYAFFISSISFQFFLAVSICFLYPSDIT